MRRRRYIIGLAAVLFAGYAAYAQSGGMGDIPDAAHPDAAYSDAAYQDVARLLAGFLENDIQLKELAIKARQAELDRKQTGIENGFDLTLSTGTMTLYAASAGPGETAFSVTPRAELSFPQLNGAKLGVTVPVTVSSGGGNENDVAMENAQVTLSATLIGPAGKRRTVALLKSDRAVLEARRALTRRGREAEKAFYERLRSLYEGTVQALELENTAYTKEIEMAVARAQGYAPSSVRCRTVGLEAADAHRAAQEQRRKVQRKLELFARDCGYNGDADTLMPLLLPEADLEGAPEFGANGERERFTEIEAAQWARHIGALSREADGQMALSAEGGFTANNTRIDGGVSADTGLTLSWRGLSLSAGAQVPVSGGGRTAFTLSLGLNTGRQRLGALSGEEKALAAEFEALALQTAERNWADMVNAVRTERADLVWEQKRLAEQYALYRELAEDTTAQYRDGMVTESEYRKAVTNEQRTRYQILAADAQNLIHLINTGLYIVD